MNEWSSKTEIGPGFATGFMLGLIAAFLICHSTINKYKEKLKQAELDTQHQVEYVQHQCSQMIAGCNKE